MNQLAEFEVALEKLACCRVRSQSPDPSELPASAHVSLNCLSVSADGAVPRPLKKSPPGAICCGHAIVDASTGAGAAPINATHVARVDTMYAETLLTTVLR